MQTPLFSSILHDDDAIAKTHYSTNNQIGDAFLWVIFRGNTSRKHHLLILRISQFSNAFGEFASIPIAISTK